MGAMLKELDKPKTCHLLNQIMMCELAGVVAYTHWSLMVIGPNRLPIVAFLKAQANESLLHAQQVGEILTGLDGHPALSISPITETNQHTIREILAEAVAHEKEALDLYKNLLYCVQDASIYLEEFARGMIGQEELHHMELKKMLRDYA
jgi:bacterioferritin